MKSNQELVEVIMRKVDYDDFNDFLKLNKDGYTLVNRSDNEWIRYDKNIRSDSNNPTSYGVYECYREGCGKHVYQTWNNTGWAYDNNDISHWREIKAPTN